MPHSIGTFCDLKGICDPRSFWTVRLMHDKRASGLLSSNHIGGIERQGCFSDGELTVLGSTASKHDATA